MTIPAICFNLYDGLYYTNVESEQTEPSFAHNQITIWAQETDYLKLTDTGVWVGDLKTIKQPEPDPEPSDDDNEQTNESSPEETSNNDSEGEYPELGIGEFGGANPKIANSMYTIKFINKNAKFYSIDDQDHITPYPSSKEQPKIGYWYTIMEERVIDNKRYAHSYGGWWCEVPLDKDTPVEPAELIPLKGYDDWTVNQFNSVTSIKTNPDVVQLIYAMATHRIIARSSTGVSEHTTVVKNKVDILNELNWLYRLGMTNPVTYHLRKNEFLMFVTYTNHQPPAYDLTSDTFSELTMDHRRESCENLERNPTDNATVNAIFIIEDITYTDNQIGKFPITDIKLRCFWTDGTIGEPNQLLQ